MKKFIKNLLKFSVLVFIIPLLILIILTYLDRKNANFKLSSNPKYLIIGHSHPECAFNDSIISNFKNVSSSGESYFYNYVKLKKIVHQNPSIDVVFIEFTNNQVNIKMDEWIWGNKYMSKSFPKYSSFMDFEDHYLLMKKNPVNYLNTTSLSLKRKIEILMRNKVNYSSKIGGYLHLKRDKTDSILKKRDVLKPKKISINNISKANLLYLDKMVSFCKKNGKRVVFIRSPQHKKYLGYSNEKVYKKILESRYSDIEYLDFSNFELKNSQFGDLEHLNYKGAIIFSKWFNHYLKNNLF